MWLTIQYMHIYLHIYEYTYVYPYLYTLICIYVCIYDLYLYVCYVQRAQNSVAIDYSYAASTVKPPNSPATPQGGTHIYTYIYIYLYTLAYWIYYTTDTPLPTHTAGGEWGAVEADVLTELLR